MKMYLKNLDLGFLFFLIKGEQTCYLFSNVIEFLINKKMQMHLIDLDLLFFLPNLNSHDWNVRKINIVTVFFKLLKENKHVIFF